MVDQFCISGFDHDANQRLSTRCANQDSPLISHRGFGLCDRLLHGITGMPVTTHHRIFYTHVFEALRVGFKALGDQFGQRASGVLKQVSQVQRGQNTVACEAVMVTQDMA